MMCLGSFSALPEPVLTLAIESYEASLQYFFWYSICLSCLIICSFLLIRSSYLLYYLSEKPLLNQWSHLHTLAPYVFTDPSNFNQLLHLFLIQHFPPLCTHYVPNLLRTDLFLIHLYYLIAEVVPPILMCLRKHPLPRHLLLRVLLDLIHVHLFKLAVERRCTRGITTTTSLLLIFEHLYTGLIIMWVTYFVRSCGQAHPRSLWVSDAAWFAAGCPCQRSFASSRGKERRVSSAFSWGLAGGRWLSLQVRAINLAWSCL